MRYLIRLATILTLVALSSCNNVQKSDNTAVNDTAIIKDLTIRWNDCLVKQDLQTLKSLYAEQVSLYGTSISKEQTILNKRDFFKKYSDFNQSITGEITVTKVTDQQYKASFPKRSTYNGRTSDVQGYLIFDKLSGNWLITNESDEITDRNITKVGAKEKTELKTCKDIAMEIMRTSPAYRKITRGLYEAVVRNGGTSISILTEGSPNPEMDGAMGYSDTYDFSVHETYSDRMPVVARFSFNPADRQLYEYNVVEDKLYPIDFDRKLLLKFNEICNK